MGLLDQKARKSLNSALKIRLAEELESTHRIAGHVERTY
jgi:hypothetical protein